MYICTSYQNLWPNSQSNSIHIYEYMDTTMALVDNKLNIQRQRADILAHLNACTPSLLKEETVLEKKPQEAAIILQQVIRHSAKSLEILV